MNKILYLPVIGITTYGRNAEGRYHLPGEYVDAVRAAGGLPILLPPGETELEQILDTIDGLILAGGGDIHPGEYQGGNHPEIERVDIARDKFELEISKKVLEMDIPVLGICRGQQILNIVTGGALIDHLPDLVGDKVTHRAENGEPVEHPVNIEPGSRLEKISGGHPLMTFSQHHQAVHNVSGVWRITASAGDGVIEALEHRRHPWMMAVQWHPELSIKNERHLKLFAAHIEAARQRREQQR